MTEKEQGLSEHVPISETTINENPGSADEVSSENQSNAVGGLAYMQLQRKYIETLETVKFYQEKASMYLKENRDLKLKLNELHHGGIPYSLLIKSIDAYLPDGLKYLLHMQLKSKQKFSDEERKFIVGLYKSSPEAYAFLQKEGVNLPLEKDVLKLKQRQEAAEMDEDPSSDQPTS